MKKAGNTRGEVGRIVHADASTVGKVIRGSRKATKSVMQTAVQHYDDGQLYIAAAAEVTGGASVPWLNGADLHPSSAYIKTLEEIREAEECLLKLPVTKHPEHLSEPERKQIKGALLEQLEAITALTHNVAVQCRKYGFSYLGLWKEHHSELASKNYLK